MAYQELNLIIANDVLDECRNEAVNIKTNLMNRLYHKFKKEIIDTFNIREFITKQMTYGRTFIKYTYIGANTCQYKNIMHEETKLNFDGIFVSCKDMMNIFTTNMYGEDILVDLLKKEFPYPFKIISEYTYHEDCGYYHSIIISWPKENCMPHSNDNDNKNTIDIVDYIDNFNEKDKECILI